ncbi:MAG TPA: nitrogenase molybdenum-iron protein alpha chain, partial [Desulfocapsa sulfexigens]|nr:nitrogenase molybdenum-iron protein alpha chain [Desulfocapsa sulfexigens]
MATATKKKKVHWDPADVKAELLKKYPPKVARKRSKQIMINEALENETPEISANVRSTPGIITMRGCTYAGCKGVLMGPTRDIVNLVHGPIGCSFYAWLTRRNQTDAGLDGENYINYSFSTDMQEQDIIFGGEKKLEAAIQEIYDLMHPKSIAVFATCPVGLIGDDIHTVTRLMKEKLGDCNVFAFSCEGYKGVSQSAGHHIANNQVFKHMLGEDDTPVEGKFKINLLGEYNIGGDGFEIDRILKKCGITNILTFSGNSTYEKYATAHHADLNTVMCHRSINYVGDMMEIKFGIPWIKVNFIGAKSTAKSLRKIAAYFEDQGLIDRVEEVIKEEMPEVEATMADVRSRTEGKTAMLFVGGSRAHHYQELF